MSDPDPNAERERMLEEIVAYLDGELSPAESAEVERRLARDETFRQEMQGIERAWSALDDLPRTTLDDRFARTTMELVVAEANSEVDALTRAVPVQRRQRQWSTALGALAAALLGFLAVRLVREAPNRALVADLTVIRNVDGYWQLPRGEQDADAGQAAIEFLADLEKLHGTRLRAATASGSDLETEAIALAGLNDAAARRAWLSDLSPEDAGALAAQAERFRAMTPAEQERMRDINAAVYSSPDPAPEKLLETLLVYRRWLSQLSTSDQYELRKLSPGERLLAIEVQVTQQSVDAALTLTEPELRRVVETVMHEFPELARPGVEERPGQRFQRFLNSPRDGAPLPEAIQDRFQKIHDALPPRTQEVFDDLDPWDKRNQLMSWMRLWMSMRGDVTRSDLEEFFTKNLDDETRAELLALPADEMEARLKQLYRRSSYGGFGDFGGRGQPRGPGFQRGEGRRGPGPGQWNRPGVQRGFGPDGEGPPPDEFDGPPYGPGFGRGPGFGPGPGPNGERWDQRPPPDEGPRPGPPPPRDDR